MDDMVANEGLKGVVGVVVVVGYRCGLVVVVVVVVPTAADFGLVVVVMIDDMWWR